ncbi:MAG: MBL fold metallo-hydrolase, partial [Lentisphaeria bacterium]|nr:MBL fold metallo-hydrolase [Lentisphaeria bacterium]
MDFGFTILGSGSRGNATVIHTAAGNLLLDAGFSAKELCTRMEKRAIDPASIQALLITHEHEDHIRGCRVFADKFSLPVYETAETARAITHKKMNASNVVLIQPGNKFELCGLTIEPFSVSHDVVDAVAYTFCRNGLKLGYATDLGCTNLLVMNTLRNCKALVLEPDYEPA